MVNKPLLNPYFLGGVALGGAARIPLNFVTGHQTLLVGVLNPSEKYARQIGSFAQVGMKIKHV